MDTEADGAIERKAACRCGSVLLVCTGEPERVSVCHCLACQRRTGSVFSAQARFAAQQVRSEGETRAYTRVADSGKRALYQFCPICGTTVAYANESDPEMLAIPLGNFIEPLAITPTVSYFERRQRSWLVIQDSAIQHVEGDS